MTATQLDPNEEVDIDLESIVRELETNTKVCTGIQGTAIKVESEEGGVKEKIFLNHLFPHSLFLKRILPSPRNNLLLERKTNNDVARIGEGVMNSEHYSTRESLSVRSSLVKKLSRSIVVVNCKITVASEQLDHHSTETGP